MNITILLSPGSIIAIVISIVAFLIASAIVLYFLIIRNHRLGHAINELLHRYEYIHVVLTEQDYGHIKRLETISQLNLLYNDVYQDFASRYKPLMETEDKEVKDKLLELKSFFDAKKFQNARKEFSSSKETLIHFEEAVNSLNDELIKISRQENDLKQQAMSIRDRLNAIKDSHNSHQNELSFMKNTYNAIYEHIDSLLIKFDGYIDEANYEDSKNVILEVKKIVDEFEKANEVLPRICFRASRLIPQKIGDLKSELKRMQNDGCPVQHIVGDKTIKTIEQSLAKVVKDLKGFSYKHANEHLDVIERNIDNILKEFENERSDRKIFESIADSVDLDARKHQSNFIKLCNNVHEIKKVYKISEEKDQQLDKINVLVDRLSFNKRAFDDISHSKVKPPYSHLLTRANTLKSENTNVDEELRNFRQYLASLKTDVEAAHNLLSTTFYRLKKIEKILRDSSVDSLLIKYADKLESVYEALDKISIISSQLPIDVVEINKAADYIRYDAESFFNQIEQDCNIMKLAESAIVFANRGRNKSSEINMAVIKSEQLFNDGNFERSYNEMSECINRFNELENTKKKR